jgi:hypothetical protein
LATKHLMLPDGERKPGRRWSEEPPAADKDAATAAARTDTTREMRNDCFIFGAS